MRLRTSIAVVVALALLPSLVFAQSKKTKKTVSAIFANAQYVWVESEDGDIFNPNLLREDRQAIVDTENAIRDWNRYTLTARREEAELVFIVRKGRLATGKLGTGVGPGPSGGQVPGQQGPIGRGVMVGGEAGPPDDLLEVRTMQDGKLSLRLWERSQPDGLEGPRVPLLQALRTAVEHDYPK
ncbi:MAG TPA: hypothetical protein VG225_09580 [Terracidiphilus sp.]|jgi:hypothetical protein|nr:hypothetical protein [Terracidiphilus sp.]